jgi:hypothetical protein
MRLLRFCATVLLCIAFPASLIWAGCKSDCRDDYESEVESCKLMHDSPDDADDLTMCIQSAKDDYDSCVEECDG